MDDDDPRELREYEADDTPSPWQRRQRILRWVAIIAMIGMLVPTVIGSYSTARATAERSCRLAVNFYADERTPSRVAFELLSPEALGWNCYAVLGSGDVLVAVLGLIPGQPRLVPRVLS